MNQTQLLLNMNTDKKYLCLVLISIVVLVITGLCFWNYKRITENSIWKLKSTLLEYKFELSDWEERKLYELKTEGVLLPDSLLDTMVKYSILRLHDGICMSCFADNLSQLIKFVQKDSIPILILGNYMYKSAFKEDLRIIGGDNFKLLNLPSLSIMPADSLEQPYLFEVGVDGKIQNVFFINKDKYELANSYLKSIINKRNDK
mgnify:CR=1 FL=1